MARAKIVIVDDHQFVAEAMKQLLEPEFEVVRVYSSGAELLRATSDLKPDIAILDIGMPSMNGIIVCSHLKKIEPKLKVVFVTMTSDRETVSEAFKAGASGYVVKTSSASELKTAVREVLRGGNFASASLIAGIRTSFVQEFKNYRPKVLLTTRQKEVLQLLTEGLSMKQVAYKLNITKATVAFHKYTMMESLGVSSSSELIAYAVRNDFLPQNQF